VTRLPLLFGFQEPENRERELPPVVGLGRETQATGRRERIHARLAVVLAERHFGCEESRRLEPVQRGIERALADGEGFARDLVEPLLNAPSVVRSQRERLEDQEVQPPCRYSVLGIAPLVWREDGIRIARYCQVRPPQLPATPSTAHSVVVGPDDALARLEYRCAAAILSAVDS
jgi:hypothetical protein